jgi:hypothetical protein
MQEFHCWNFFSRKIPGAGSIATYSHDSYHRTEQSSPFCVVLFICRNSNANSLHYDVPRSEKTKRTIQDGTFCSFVVEIMALYCETHTNTLSIASKISIAKVNEL